MTFQTLTPVQLVPNAAGLDLTGALATPTNVNLAVHQLGAGVPGCRRGSTSETVTLDIGVTILGQTVTNFTAVALTNAHTYLFGPFSAQVDQPGSLDGGDHAVHDHEHQRGAGPVRGRQLERLRDPVA